MVTVDALDEGSSDFLELARTLRELAKLDTVRLVVATRPRYTTNTTTQSVAASSLLTALAVEDESLIDLDSDQYFEREGLVTYVEELLTQQGPRGRAWSTYRFNRPLRRRLAEAITRRARRNYLVAVMAADPLHEQRLPLDPGAPEFDSTAIPSTVGDALEHYLHSLPDKQQQLRRGILTALAYARGDGLDDQLWRQFATALGYPASQLELDALRSSAAADYLLQTGWQGGGGRRVWRIFHQALSDQLLTDPGHARDRVTDETALTRLLQYLSVHPHDAVADAYISAHLAEHAAAAGMLPKLIHEPDFVLRADLQRLLPLLRHSSLRNEAVGAVLRRVAARATTARQADRGQVIAVCAAHMGYHSLCQQYGRRIGPMRPRWAHSIGDEHEEITGHADRVTAVAFGHLPDGRTLLASASWDHTVRLWDPTPAPNTPPSPATPTR